MLFDKSLWKVEKKLDTDIKGGKYFISLAKLIIPEHTVLLAEEVSEERLPKWKAVQF